MIGCALAAVGAVALVRLAVRAGFRRRGWGGGGCGPRGFGRHGHHGHHGAPGYPGEHEQGPYRQGAGPGAEQGPGGFGSGYGPQAWLARELRLTPEQEKVAFAAWDEVREASKKARGEVDRTRADLEKAFGPDLFDAETVGNTFARHDELVEGVRIALTGALAKVHEVLDPSQRRHLAGLLASGGGWFRRWGGWAR